MGHTGMNYALRYLPAYLVNLTVLGEPIGATILAFLIPSIREVPRAGTVLGGVITLLGVGAAALRQGKTRDEERAAA
jgi:drug/metabolite transporter (DMT)-like permease